MWDEIEHFDAFSLFAIPREQNSKADCLAVSTSLLIPHPEFNRDFYTVEMIHRPSVPDNDRHWKVFDDDGKIIAFLEGRPPFSDLKFEGSRNHNGTPRDDPEVIQLEGNVIPRGLVTLEILFDKEDRRKEKVEDTKSSNCSGYEKVNIGSEGIPKMVLIGKDLTSEEKEEFMKFLKAYQDIFAWSYEDLKEFMNGKFKHQIPLKPGSTPFWQKKRQFNLKVADTIFNEVDKMLKEKIIYPIHHST